MLDKIIYIVFAMEGGIMDITLEKTKDKGLPVWRRKLHRHLPVTRWLPLYRKEDVISDLIAGLTLGLTMVPQSIAYSALAGLTSQVGRTPEARR